MHGDWCHGYLRPGHPAADLTVDHIVPLAAGGAPFDIGNTSVLCRSCNSTKGASTDRGGVAHVATPLPADRARFGTVHVTDGGTRLYEADVTERDWIAFRACLNLWDWQKNGGKAA